MELVTALDRELNSHVGIAYLILSFSILCAVGQN